MLEVVERPELVKQLLGEQVHSLPEAFPVGGNPVEEIAGIDQNELHQAQLE